MWLVNLSGKPSVKHGIPYPVFARVSMGVFGANFPAMARGLVAMFWYGAQTYAASTAVALLITGITVMEGEVMFLGMTGVMWVSFIFVSAFQVYLFWQGVDLIKKFLNFAGLPCKYWKAKPQLPKTQLTKIVTSPIIIIGVTEDPATPYEWSQNLAKVFPNSKLLTLRGEGHTGHNQGNKCVDSAVDSYYLTGKIRTSALICA